MGWRYIIRIAVLRLVTVLFLGASGVYAQDFSGISFPQTDVKLGFAASGLIADVFVNPGDKVEPGQKLLALQDEVIKARLARMKAEAETEARVDSAEAEARQKAADVVKYEEACQKGAITKQELEYAQLEALVAECKHRIAVHERTQAEKQHTETEAESRQYQLLCPIRGVVEEVLLKKGEPAQALSPVIRVVDTSVLRIDVIIPLAYHKYFMVGETVKLYFPGGPESDGKVIFVASAADPASSTVKVSVEYENKTGRISGERVGVRPAGLPQPQESAEEDLENLLLPEETPSPVKKLPQEPLKEQQPGKELQQ